MKRVLILLSVIIAISLHAADLDFAYRIKAEIQTAGRQSLDDQNWQQGITPLIRVDVESNGRSVDADLDMIVRMIIGPSSTSNFFAVVTNNVATNTYYLIQWPTIGTNTTDTAPWFFTIYFEKNGTRWWSGNGDLYIEETESTAEDGLIWQTIVSTTPVSTNSAGLAPQLPGTADTYLSGTGVYSVPLGGLSSITNALAAYTATSNYVGITSRILAIYFQTNFYTTAEINALLLAQSNNLTAAWIAADVVATNAARVTAVALDAVVTAAYIAADIVATNNARITAAAMDAAVTAAYIAADIIATNAARITAAALDAAQTVALTNGYISADEVVTTSLTAYVDAATNGCVQVTGDTMTGPLTQAGGIQFDGDGLRDSSLDMSVHAEGRYLAKTGGVPVVSWADGNLNATNTVKSLVGFEVTVNSTNSATFEWYAVSNRFAIKQIIGGTTNVTFVSPE